MFRSLLLVLCCGGALAREYHRAADAKGAASGPRAIDAAEYTTEHWADEARAAIYEREARAARRGKARNVVMFLGDGMSVPTLAAARTLLGQRQGRAGEEARLSFESFPTVGLVKTYCLNAQIPDSACTATAYLCGVKAHQGTLGVNGAVQRHDCAASAVAANRVESIAEWALADGRDAGVVTTTRITHASPAGAYAKAANRHYESDTDITNEGLDINQCPDIAHQLINLHPGNKFKVILGGGRRELIPNDYTDEEGFLGRRSDGRNLIEEWQNQKQAAGASYSYVWNREQLMALSDSPPEYLLGLFESDHLQYHLRSNTTTEPTLAELTETAIRTLSRNENGFFLFVEGGRIDHAHHDNLVHLALDETIEMAAAVQRATELLAEEDSLIVVTADHAHVMAFNGYTPRGSDILGASNDRDIDGVPYMTLSYTNGPGARRHVDGVRPDVTRDADYQSVDWLTHADAPLESETHGGDDVAVFARGANHGAFAGLYEQSQLPHLMAYAACIGPGAHACSGAALHFSMLPLALLVLHASKYLNFIFH